MTQIAECPLCGDIYEIYMYFAEDQSICPNCRTTIRDQVLKKRRSPITYWEYTVDNEV
jgi:uncharacterized paraquat-inducible protein A